jgi:hypothetical protein
MVIFSDANREAEETIQESGVDTSSSSTGDDVADPFNLKEDDLRWKYELC